MAKCRESGADWRRWRRTIDSSLRALVVRGAMSPALALRLRHAATRDWAMAMVDYADELTAGHSLAPPPNDAR